MAIHGTAGRGLCYLKFLSKVWSRMRVAHGSIYEVGDEVHSRDREKSMSGDCNRHHHWQGVNSFLGLTEAVQWGSGSQSL